MISGAGNPVGGSFTGPSEALEIIGNHGYAYSGSLPVNNNFTELISYTSGNYYADLNFVPFFGIESESNDEYLWRVRLNGQVVYQIMVENQVSTANWFGVVGLIIPSYTEVRVEAKNASDSTANNVGALLTGRIYRK